MSRPGRQDKRLTCCPRLRSLGRPPQLATLRGGDAPGPPPALPAPPALLLPPPRAQGRGGGEASSSRHPARCPEMLPALQAWQESTADSALTGRFCGCFQDPIWLHSSKPRQAVSPLVRGPARHQRQSFRGRGRSLLRPCHSLQSEVQRAWLFSPLAHTHCPLPPCGANSSALAVPGPMA